MLSHWDTLSVTDFTGTVEKKSFIRSSLKRQQDLSLPQIVLHLPIICLEHWKSPDIFSSSCLNPPPSCASCSPSPPPYPPPSPPPSPPHSPPPYPTPPPAASSCLVGISRWSPKEEEARKTEAEELVAHLFQNTWGFQPLGWKWWFCSPEDVPPPDVVHVVVLSSQSSRVKVQSTT